MTINKFTPRRHCGKGTRWVFTSASDTLACWIYPESLSTQESELRQCLIEKSTVSERDDEGDLKNAGPQSSNVFLHWRALAAPESRF